MSETLADTHVLFRAFADPTRLRLLNLLLEGERCVCDLCAVLETPQPSVSRHLAYLRRARLVTMRRDGRWKYYAAAKAPPGVHRTLLRCVRSCLREINVLRNDLARLKQVGRPAAAFEQLGPQTTVPACERSGHT